MQSVNVPTIYFISYVLVLHRLSEVHNLFIHSEFFSLLASLVDTEVLMILQEPLFVLFSFQHRLYLLLTIDVAFGVAPLFLIAQSLIILHGFLQCFNSEKLNLKKVDEYKYLKQSCCYSIAGVDDAEMFRTVTV